MKIEDIKNLVLGLDNDSPYLTEVRRRFFPRKRTLTTAERLIYPMSDPAFVWHFASAYHRARRAIPNEVYHDAIWRAFCCLEGDGFTRWADQDCHEAIALNHPANRCKQVLLKALWCSEMEPDDIAEHCGKSADVLQIFYELFFDFRERKDDRLFVLKVLNPRGELISFKLGEQDGKDWALTLMNIGYRLGAGAVLKELGLDRSQTADFRSDGELMDGAKRALLAAAETKAQLGLLSPGDPGFGLLKVVTAEHAKHDAEQVDEDARMGLTRLSMDQGAMLVFKRIVTAAAEERQRHAQAYDASKSAEEVKKKLAEGNSKTPAIP